MYLVTMEAASFLPAGVSGGEGWRTRLPAPLLAVPSLTAEGVTRAPQSTVQRGQPLPFLNFPFLFSWNNANTTHMDFKFLFLGLFRKFPPGDKGWGRGCRWWPRAGPSSPAGRGGLGRGSWRSGGSALVPPLTRPPPFHPLIQGRPGGASGEEPACQCRRHKRHGFDPWVGRSPGEGNGNPLQYSCLENPYGQRSLAGYSPQLRT